MRYLSIIALLLVGCNQSDSNRLESFRSMLSETGVKLTEAQSASVVILHENTAALQKIADSVDSIATDTKETKEAVEAIASQEAVQVESETANGKEVILSVESPSDVQVVKADTSGGVHLEQWTAKWCRFCPAAKVNAEAAAKRLGIELKMIDYDLNKQHVAACKIESLPTLAIVRDGKSRRRLKNIQSVDAIVAAVEAVKGGNYASIEGAVVAPAPMSYSEMVSLHNSLHGPGSWSWPGDLAEHLRDVHGIDTGTAMESMRKPQFSQSYPQSRTWTLFGWGLSRRGR